MQKITESAKNITSGIKMAYDITTKNTYPWFVNFRITYKCNFRCHYCDSPNKNIPEMSTKEIMSMIDELKSLGLRKLAFSGGEPLIRHDIGQLITYCKSKNIFTNIVSNGSLFPKKAEELKDVDYICFSLDGTKETNDAVRGEGSFDKVMKSIEIAQKMKKQVNIICVLTKENTKDIDELLALSEQKKIGVLFQPVDHYALATDKGLVDKLKSTHNEHVKAMKHIIKRQKEGYNILYSRHHYEYLSSAFFVENRRECKHKGKFFASINSDGRVSACTPKDLDDHWINGNKVGWKKALDHAKTFNCEGCYSSWLEIDDLSDMNLKVVKYWVKNKSHIIND